MLTSAQCMYGHFSGTRGKEEGTEEGKKKEGKRAEEREGSNCQKKKAEEKKAKEEAAKKKADEKARKAAEKSPEREIRFNKRQKNTLMMNKKKLV